MAEDAVLGEMREILGGVTLPPGFEEHLRKGASDKPSFLRLFGCFVARELRENSAFRDLFMAGRLLKVESLAFDTRALAHRIEEQFGGTLERVEGKLDAQGEKLEELIALMSVQKGVPAAPLCVILQRLGEVDVPDDQISHRLAAKAEEYLALREQWAKLAFGHPDLAAVRNEALAQIDAGDLDGARALLVEALVQIRRARQDRLRDEASLLVDLAGIDRLELRYRAAADRYREAATLVESFDPATCSGFLVEGGGVLQEQGVEFGDNDALRSAINVFREAARLRPRIEQPVEWAKIQIRLGNAHAVLGERERGTGSLESAVDAYRAASEELSREEMPLDWATSQHNLANVLQSLGDRELGTDRQKEAIAIYRAALEEITRQRSPLNWAMIQNNLGNALLALGRRENESHYAEEAVDAFRNSLQEWTRDRVPLRWATVQNNLGNGLAFLGEREHSTANLNEAITAYYAALEEWTRERVPLDWAMTQHNLGKTLLVMGRSGCGITLLEEAVERFRATLDEWTRERVSLDWTVAQLNLGDALAVLGECTNIFEHLEEAVRAYHHALEEIDHSGAEFFRRPAEESLDKALAALAKMRAGA
jgi:tetratricopeptide (TPR) repeat protein